MTGADASLWEATARPAPNAQPLVGAAQADVVVIGGGFCGLACALRLAEAGTDTVLLEAQGPGWGASGRNGGQLIPCFKENPEELVARHGPKLGEAMSALGAEGGNLVAALIERHGIDCALRRNGWILGIHSEAALPMIEARARQWNARGYGVRVLDRSEVADLTGCGQYVAGYLDPAGGGLHPLSFARGLAGAAQRAGTRIHAKTPALRLSRDGDGWRVETPEGSVGCAQVIVATGAHSADLIPALRRSILPMQSLQIATAPLPSRIRSGILSEGHVLSDTRRLLTYFRLTYDGRLVFGGRGSTGGEAVKRAHLARLEATMQTYFPKLRGVPVTHRWAGQVDLTPGRSLRVHRPEPGLLAVIGFNGRGVAIAPAVGTALAEAVLAGDPSALPLPVTPLRAVPFHAARRPAMVLALGWAKMRDYVERHREAPSGR